MLSQVLEGNIQITDKAENWEDSIRIAAKPLLDKELIEENYVSSMIKSINENGFYVVLRENLAMPHARPEDAVKQNCLSLLKLHTPVMYGEHKVQLVVVLAATSSDGHIDMLMSLSELFQSDEDIDTLIKANDNNEIVDILKKY